MTGHVCGLWTDRHVLYLRAMNLAMKIVDKERFKRIQNALIGLHKRQARQIIQRGELG